MLKTKLSIIAIAAVFTTTSLYAVPTDKYFIGFDVQDNFMRKHSDVGSATINGRKIAHEVVGATPLLGYRWTRFGIELGHTFLGRVTYYGNNRTKLQKDYNSYIDLQFYKRIVKKLEFKALLGLGRLSTEYSGNAVIVGTSKIASNGEQKFRSTGVRVGAGLQLCLTKNVSSSLMYKYQKGNGIFNAINTVALGITFNL